MSETLCYFQSGIGNLVLATPAMQAMASLDPTGKVDVLLDPKYRKDSRYPAIVEILSLAPWVSSVVEFGKQNGHYRRHFVPVQSEVSPAGRWACERSPTKGKWPGARWHEGCQHEIEANMRFARAHGYAGKIPRPWVPVAEWPVLAGPRPWIGLCNSSFGSHVWEKKRWEWFPEMAEMLAMKYGGTVFGVGGEGDLREVPWIANFSGRTSIAETAKVLSQLDLLVTTDTGCMHVADALDVPLVALFGPTIVDKNAPVGRRSWFLRSNLPCAPCQYKGEFYACKHWSCMRLIRPEDVLWAIEESGVVDSARAVDLQAAKVRIFRGGGPGMVGEMDFQRRGMKNGGW